MFFIDLNFLIDHWQSILDDNIVNLLRTELDIHDKAVAAINALCSEYYRQENGLPKPDKQGENIGGRKNQNSAMITMNSDGG